MKTKLLNFLRVNLHNQNGMKNCPSCTEAMGEILTDLKNNKPVTIILKPNFNVSNVCMGFHIDNKQAK